jgi:hypothetical protein
MSEARTSKDEVRPVVCNWQRNEDGNDDTECGGTWCLMDGTPPENSMKYCPYCGKLIAWGDHEPEDDDDE